ncbi:MAG: hypothetical protein E7420_04280 [Ruminococcaceae bacterium]|nr:hypothetical protein [Oscillospiraceae bacterium]
MNTLIVGEKYRKKLENSLISLGFDVYWLPNNEEIDEKLSSHADLSVFVYKKTAILAKYLKENKLVNFLTNRGFNVIISDFCQSAQYPNDINLCAALIGDRIMHHIRFTDKNILDLITDYIDVKQGYTRCSCLVINDSVITSDKGIEAALKSYNIETLLIDENGIVLDGYDRGFIGGASFVAGDTVYFTGDIYKHPSGKIITDYISAHNFKICCLSDDVLFDIGGAVLLT